MTKQRVPETDHGIRGEFNVTVYDQMQRRLRDKGWIETKELLKHGITQGCALEIGPGPGYLGLEWLKRTQGTTLKGVDISTDMIAVAERNAREYGFSQRVEYVHSSGSRMPFDDNTFDAVFTTGSLHEWADPRSTFNEIWRVLKPGAKFSYRICVAICLHWRGGSCGSILSHRRFVMDSYPRSMPLILLANSGS
ncbi:MAG: class I SAM-dependent methyltransferase [Candidatus Bathyarchaeia archaeon]